MATHNIMAYRIFNEDRNVFIHDCDNDGETAAGSQLLRMLEVSSMSCHVMSQSMSCLVHMTEETFGSSVLDMWCGEGYVSLTVNANVAIL